MIKINLMVKPPPRFVWRRAAVLAGAGGALLGAMAGMAIWWAHYSRLEEERAFVALLESDYQKVFARAPSLKQQEEQVQAQQEVLARLGRNQAPTGQAAVLGQILGAAGAQVSVTEVTVGDQRQITLSGDAASFGAAMEYMAALRAMPALEAVQERKLTAPATGRTTFTFAARIRQEGRP